MRILIDTNVLLNVLKGREGSEAGRQLLNSNSHDLFISLYNITELRDVLITQDQLERAEAEKLIERIQGDIDEVVTDFPELESVDEMHESELADPPDCILFKTSDMIDGEFVSEERELHDLGAKKPAEIVSSHS